MKSGGKMLVKKVKANKRIFWKDVKRQRKRGSVREVN